MGPLKTDKLFLVKKNIYDTHKPDKAVVKYTKILMTMCSVVLVKHVCFVPVYPKYSPVHTRSYYINHISIEFIVKY